VIIGIVAAAVIALALALVVMVAKDPGPSPQDVSLAYEHAWDHLDFATLWTLSGDELRDGQRQQEFVASKRAAYADQGALGHLARHVAIERATVGRTVASVLTRVELLDGGVAHNELQLTKRAGRWVVVEYHLRSDAAPPVS
jgi:hypothetical protein